jgi:hypothetical protein
MTQPARSSDASQTHLRNRQRYGGLVGKRQREAAEKRRETGLNMIRWQDTAIWRAPVEGQRKWHDYPIQTMVDVQLWHTINYLVRHAIDVHAECGKTHHGEALAAYLWLRDQPAFRALVREAIRRDFTFPDDVLRYLKQYVLDRSETLDGYCPWADPMQTEQHTELQDLRDLPVVPPDVEYGKERRAIRLK